MFTLQVQTRNAAFEDCQGAEVARILRALADSLEGCHVKVGSLSGILRDVNGNRVGDWKLTGDPS